LIIPKEVDIYSGYRYYDDDNIETIYKIQALKDVGFSLQEIKDFDQESFKNKYKNIKKEIVALKKKLNVISYLNKQKGEKIMKPFINDEIAIGKWKYSCSAENIEKFNAGETYIDKEAIQEIYFLPNGEGYWIFEGWTKGLIYHYKGMHYKYSINGDKMFLETYDENQEYEHTLVYEKVDSRKYTEEDIRISDDTNMPFEFDEGSAGSWIAVDWIGINDKFNYIPKVKTDLFLKGLSLLPNGDCFMEYASGNIAKMNWTKNYILSHNSRLASNYIIQEIDGETYLIMDWKSGDYVYAGEIYGCYVFKKQ